jgi:hypothetical protein
MSVNKHISKKLIWVFLFSALSLYMTAAKRYWISAATASWNSTANWSSTSGGASGSSVPGSNDTCYFDGNGLGRCDINANVNVKRFEIVSTYTDTITQNAFTITVGTGGMKLDGAAVFTGSSSAITISGGYYNSACAFTSTSGTLTISSDFQLTGTGSFIHNSGTATFNGSVTCTMSCSTSSANKKFNNLTFNITSATRTNTITSGDTIFVTGSYTVSGSGHLILSTGVLSLTGDLTLSNTNTSGSGGSGIMYINGSSNQSFTGPSAALQYRLPALKIDKSGGSLSLYNYINVSGAFTYVRGSINYGTSVFVEGAVGSSISITCNDTLKVYDFLAYPSLVTLSSGSVIRVNHNLSTMAGTGLSLGGGTIEVKGNFNINNASGSGGGSTVIKINGSGTQKMESTAGFNQGAICNVEVSKSATDTLKLIGVITCNATWTYTSGIIDPGTSTLGLRNSSGSFKAYNLTYRENPSALDLDGDTITVTGTLKFTGATTYNRIDNGVLKAMGNIITENTNTSGVSGSAVIYIAGTANQTITGSGISSAGSLSKLMINKPSGTLFLASIISVSQDWEYIAGTVDASTYTSKVYFSGTHNLDAQGSSSSMSFYDATVSGSRTLTGNMAASNDLTINSSSTLAQSTYTLSFGGYANNGTHSGSGAIKMIGNGYHTFSKSGGGTTSFGTVTVNRDGGSISLSSPINVTGSMTFTKGIIKTTSTNLLKFADNATVSGGSDSGYVMGPVIKTGNDSIVFPLGDSSNLYNPYRPISISAPSSATDAFTARYYHASAPNPDDLPDTIQSVSNCEYWTLKRNTGSSNVKTAVWWSETDCPVYANDAIEIANYDSIAKQWIPIGGTIADNDTLDDLSRIVSPNNVSFTLVGPILISIVKKITPGYPIVERSYTSQYYLTPGKILNFEYYEEYNDADQRLTYTIKRLSNNKTELSESGYALTVVPGTNRYTMNLNTISPGTFTTGYYLLEIVNEKQEKFYLRFKI